MILDPSGAQAGKLPLAMIRRVGPPRAGMTQMSPPLSFSSGIAKDELRIAAASRDERDLFPLRRKRRLHVIARIVRQIDVRSTGDLLEKNFQPWP